MKEGEGMKDEAKGMKVYLAWRTNQVRSTSLRHVFFVLTLAYPFFFLFFSFFFALAGTVKSQSLWSLVGWPFGSLLILHLFLHEVQVANDIMNSIFVSSKIN